jgi:hypothetical protein
MRSTKPVVKAAQPIIQQASAEGFGDRTTACWPVHITFKSTIPVLVTYQGKAKRDALTGATVIRQLPSIDGAAVEVDKKNAMAFLTATGAKARSVAGGYDKIWLDGKRKISLDQSVPQIGAPVAWQAAGAPGRRQGCLGCGARHRRRRNPSRPGHAGRGREELHHRA